MIALAGVSKGLWTWVLRLGGPGLIVVGLVDNSVIPIPGGMDFFLIVLTARDRRLWLYYAFMAVVGAVVGGYITYYLAEKGGKEGLEKKIGKERAEKVYKKFEKEAFSTVAIGAIVPPPFPLVPVLMAAGVLQYPRKKFLTALTAGRTVRFVAVALLGRIYGTAIIRWLSRYYRPFLYTLIAAGVAGGIAALVYFKWYRPKHKHAQVAASH
ncbi:MAG TPA: VTT domain-containing protein [Candidatus Sulfotelmatobacter sp.]|nr:VTT domain-containing protein [Candidatus Sulfotelmatobacter sp.]